MSKPSNIQKFYDHFTTDLSEVNMSDSDKQVLIRYRDTYFHLLESFALTDSEIISYLINTYDIGKSQAYRDLNAIKFLFKNIQNASRQHIQHVVNQTLLEEIAACKDDPKLHRERIMAADKLAKYNRLDKEESLDIPFDEIVPIPIHFTDDPSELGLRRMTKEERDKEKAELYKKYDVEIVDTPYTEVSKDGKE